MRTRMWRAFVLTCALTLSLGTLAPVTAGEDRRDRALASQVEAALRQTGDIDLQHVKIEVRERVVELSGYASSSAQMSKAVDVTQRVEGVKEVRNGLRLKPPQDAPP